MSTKSRLVHKILRRYKRSHKSARELSMWIAVNYAELNIPSTLNGKREYIIDLEVRNNKNLKKLRELATFADYVIA